MKFFPRTVETLFIGPTNLKGSRIRAKTTNMNRSKTVSWNYAINEDQNHINAARSFADQLEYGDCIGYLANKKGYTFIFSMKETK